MPYGLLIFLAIFSGFATHDYIGGHYGFFTFDLVMAIGLFFGLLHEYINGGD